MLRLMCFKSGFPIALDVKEDRWYTSTSPHFFLVLSFALRKLCLSSCTEIVTILEQEECV